MTNENSGAKILPFARPVTGGGQHHEPYGLDPAFERALVYECCYRPRLWTRVGRHLDPGALGLATTKLVLTALRAVVSESNRPPENLLPVIQRLALLQDEGKITYEQRQAARVWLSEAAEEDHPDEDALTDEVRPILRRRAHKEAARVATQEIGKHDADMDKVVEIVTVARTIGDAQHENESRVGESSVDIIERARTTKRLPTGIPELDDVIEGGIPRGSLAVFMAASGGGKSMGLVHAAVHAALYGMRVLYITLELPEHEIHARLLANVYGESLSSILNDKDKLDEVKRRVRSAKNWFNSTLRVSVRWMAPKVTRCSDILRIVRETEKKHGERVDVVIVDYLDKVAADKVGSDDRSYRTMGDVYEVLRVWTEKEERWMWSASQTKRGGGGGGKPGSKRSTVDMDDTADSMEKVRAADQLITINPADDAYDQVSFFIAKNRRGPSRKMVGPIPTDFSRGRLVSLDASFYPVP